MRIFISELVCGGAWPEPKLNGSLAREGAAMLLALLDDAARFPGWSISTTWDHRLGDCPLPHVDCRVVSSPREEAAAFDELSRTADGTYVIAPELNDLLGARCRRVVEIGGRLLNADARSILACSDKLETGRRLQVSGIPTIDAQPLHEFDELAATWPVVVKPRFGAGSQESHLVRDAAELSSVQQRFDAGALLEQAIVQPYVPGRALSAAVIVRDDDSADVWPVAEQHLSHDGRFRYLGGRVPAPCVAAGTVQELAICAVRAFGGLRGYVGVDLLLPDASPDRPLVVELNPRLTTSYIGYRQLARTNLAPHVLQPPTSDATREQPDWTDRTISFSADGAIAETTRETI